MHMIRRGGETNKNSITLHLASIIIYQQQVLFCHCIFDSAEMMLLFGDFVTAIVSNFDLLSYKGNLCALYACSCK